MIVKIIIFLIVFSNWSGIYWFLDSGNDSLYPRGTVNGD
jgi:hypothetical protein